MRWRDLQAHERRGILDEYGSPLPQNVRGMKWDWVDVEEDGTVAYRHTGVSALRPIGKARDF